MLYVLDEPSIGLHPHDHRRLLDTLLRLRDLGNTVLVVEHDADTIRAADCIIDMGPGAGPHGGHVVFAGPPAALMQHSASLTGRYLSGRAAIEMPRRRRPGSGDRLVLEGAAQNNLKGITVEFPLGCLIGVTGVSGSGKSTLVRETLYPAACQQLHRSRPAAGRHRRLSGVEHLSQVIQIDQSPIGRTPRSNPGTYTGLLSFIRDLFARTPEARMRGFKAGRFSFNVKGGRCEACQGDGTLRIEMHFLPDVYVPCDVCAGRRYNRETLEVRYKGLSIADVLDMTVDQGLEFFGRIGPIREKLQTLSEVGLGYAAIGQAATTLSGGEAQRVKLARELSRKHGGRDRAPPGRDQDGRLPGRSGPRSRGGRRRARGMRHPRGPRRQPALLDRAVSQAGAGDREGPGGRRKADRGISARARPQIQKPAEADPAGFCLQLKGELLHEQLGNGRGLGMRKDQDQGDDQRVDTKRLDQGQTDQHGHGDLTRGLRVPGDALDRGPQAEPLCNAAAEGGDRDSKSGGSDTGDEELQCFGFHTFFFLL